MRTASFVSPPPLLRYKAAIVYDRGPDSLSLATPPGLANGTMPGVAG